MSLTIESTQAELEAPASTRPSSPLLSRIGRRLWMLIRAILNLTIGVLLCGNPWTAVLVVGWIFRAMRNQIFRGLCNQSVQVTDGTTIALAGIHGINEPERILPRWVLGGPQAIPHQESSLSRTDRAFGWLRRTIARGIGSFFANLNWGLRALFCTYIVTIPACFLWLGSWYDGWNTSFNKGYEQAFVGLQTGLGAHLLFIGAMLYVPMAWGHFAATGRLRSFFQVGFVSRLIWQNAGALMLLAAIVAVLNLPVAALRAAPFTFALEGSYWATAEPEEILRFSERYELAAGVYLLAGSLSIHLLVAFVYRRSLLRMLSKNPNFIQILPDELRETLTQLRLPNQPLTKRGPILRASRRILRVGFSLGALVMTAGLWFSVIAQIYVAQFLNMLPKAGWLNQPLIHIPCLQTTPAALFEAVSQSAL